MKEENKKLASKALKALSKEILAKEDLNRAPREDLKRRYKYKNLKDKDFRKDCKDTAADPDLSKD